MQSLQRGAVPLTFIAVWSSGYVVGALATRSVAPLALTTWRFLLAGVVFAVLARMRREALPRGRELARVVGVGIIMFGVQFSALYHGLAVGVPASTTALIACSSPVLVAALSAVLGWERPAGLQWAGIALGVVGVSITLSGRLGRPPHAVDIVWPVIGLGGLGVGAMLQGRLRVASSSPSAVAAVELLAAAAAVGVVAPFAGSMGIPGTLTAVASFVWLAVAAGVGATILMFRLIRVRGAMYASTLLLVVPSVTALASAPVLGTPLTVTTLVGLVVSGIGLVLTLRASEESRAPRRRPPQRPGAGRPLAGVAMEGPGPGQDGTRDLG